MKVSKNSRNHAHTYVLEEERVASDRCDTGRYLLAGARRAFWLRASDAQLAEAVARVKEMMQGDGHWVIESNRILDYVEPDLYVQLVDSSVDDYKESFLKHTERADAVVLVHGTREVIETNLPEKVRQTLLGVPTFYTQPPEYCPKALLAFIQDRKAKLALQRGTNTLG